jgi:Ca-activated chloride channel family protein
VVEQTPPLVAVAVLVLLGTAEVLHTRRVRHIATLAFGPSRQPAPWARFAPVLRVLSVTGLAWGLTVLLMLPPRIHKSDKISENDYRDLLLILDVSPSMRLQDAGPKAQQTRRQRASELLKSFFERTPMELYKTSIIAFYNGAKPVVLQTKDPEVVRNILEDLPMEYAFESGPTDLFAGLKEAIRIAQPWRPRGTTLVILSDGDTLPATGMPTLPASIAHVLVVGVGDPKAGRFIAGHLSRQDALSLRQLAIRLGGHYHDGNTKHLPSDLIKAVSGVAKANVLRRLTLREYALIVVGLGASVLSLLPVALHFFGTSWRPGIRSLSTAPNRNTKF